jgi:hypothetical protein
VNPEKIGDFEDIKECIEGARRSLSDALKAQGEDTKKLH